MSGRRTIRVGTFNVENLFSRLAFADAMPADDVLVGAYEFDDPVERKLARRIVEAAASDDKRQLTALALHAANADIICLQEVDDKAALDVFYQRYLKKLVEPEAARERKLAIREAARAGQKPDTEQLMAIDRRHYFDWRVQVDGNDGRGIDVAVISKFPVSVRTHAHRTFQELGVWSDELRNYRARGDRRLAPHDRVFMRDCLEIDVRIDGRPLTIYTTHLKSMSPNREVTRPYRRAEAQAIKAIITERFGERTADANWIICGDMNDYMEIDGLPVVDEAGKRLPSALDVFWQDGFADNVMRRRAPEDRWTTYHGAEDQYAQLDYMWFSPALARANPDMLPEIVRGGQPYRSQRYKGDRFPRVGWDRPKASDHCPVVCEITVP